MRRILLTSWLIWGIAACGRNLTPAQTASPTPSPSTSQMPSPSPTPSPSPSSNPIEGGLIAASVNEPLEILLFDPHGRGLKRRISTTEKFGMVQAWSPSGNRLAIRVFSTEASPEKYGVLEINTSQISILQIPGDAHSLIWVDDSATLMISGTAVYLVRAESAPQRWGGASEWGLCAEGKCSALTGLARRSDGLIAVTSEKGDVVFVSPEGTMRKSNSPDSDRCWWPHFRPDGKALGVTCTHLPPGYEPSVSVGLDEANNAWSVEVEGSAWRKLNTQMDHYESSTRYFPWEPEAKRFLVYRRSEAPCSGGFYFSDGVQKSKEFPGEFGNFSPDGTSFVYVPYPTYTDHDCGESVVVVDESGRETEVGRAGEHPPLWSPARTT